MTNKWIKITIKILTLITAFGCSSPETIEVKIPPTLSEDEVNQVFDLNNSELTTNNQSNESSDENSEVGTSANLVEPSTEPADNSANELDNSSITAPAFDPELFDNGAGALYSKAVNSALLTGPVVGLGEELNSSLYKPIQLTTHRIPADIEMLHAIAYERGNGFTKVLIYLRNISSDVRCFVEHGLVQAYDANGIKLSDSSFRSGYVVEGSLGIASNGDYSDSCVSPGEVVYVASQFSKRFTLDQIVSAEVYDLQFSSNSIVADIAVKPVSYEIQKSIIGADGIGVLVANQSSHKIKLNGAKLIILTDEGIPLGLKLAVILDPIEMQPGVEENIFFFYPSFFKGSSTNIRVILNYEPIE